MVSIKSKSPFPKVIFIVGPTASGKSNMGIKIAKKYNGEVVCADSRTIYKGLDIATAKPTPEEQDGIKHWCLDVVDPNERYSAAQFKRDAEYAIRDIQKRGKLPIVVGGSGLYIDGLLFDYKFGPVANEKNREKLEKLTIAELQAIIKSSKIDMPENNKNKRYLIRAIEQGGINKLQKEMPSRYLVVGINPGIDTIEQKIIQRTYLMVKNGALSEAENLFKTYGIGAPAALSPFYKAIAPYFNDGATIDSCLLNNVLNERNLAKRQIAWFKRNKNIKWFNSAEKAQIFIHSLCK